MKQTDENKVSASNDHALTQKNMNPLIQIGILKVLMAIAYLIGMGLALLMIIIGIASLHFNYLTITVAIIFSIFFLLVSHQIDKKSKNYLVSMSSHHEKQKN